MERRTDIQTFSPYKLRRTYDDSGTSSDGTQPSMLSTGTSTTTIVDSPSRAPEHDNDTSSFPYGSPCMGCGETFCKHMRALQTVHSQAVKYFKRGVHKQPELVQKNYLRRNFFYKLYKKHVGLTSIKKSPYCVISHAKKWFPEQHEIDSAAAALAKLISTRRHSRPNVSSETSRRRPPSEITRQRRRRRSRQNVAMEDV